MADNFDKIDIMKIILVRHGESARNAGHDVFDEENNLTIKGVKQAVEAGAELAPTKINAIYCSPAKRCEQTLDEILRVRSDDFGIHMTSLVGPKLKSENYEEVKTRVELFLDDLKYDHEESDTIVVISHQIVCGMIILLATKGVKKLANGEIVEITYSK